MHPPPPSPDLLPRAAFDAHLEAFRGVTQETIAGPEAECRYRNEVLTMLQSLRYQDRLLADLRGFFRFLKPGARVLDIGTGCGIAGFMFAAQGFPTEAIDIDDFAENPHTHSRMAAEQRILWSALMRRQPGVHFQHYHDSRIPFDDASFDAVVGYGVIEHIPEGVLEEVMRDIRRVTQPDGLLFISYLPRQWAWMEVACELLGRPLHKRRWGDREARDFLAAHRYAIEDFQRIIYAPQYPSRFTNRHKAWLDLLDPLAGVMPFALLARDLFIVARKQPEMDGGGAAGRTGASA